MKTPKEIGDFAKEYQDTYIALTQCKVAYESVVKERDHLKIALKDAHEYRDQFTKNWAKAVADIKDQRDLLYDALRDIEVMWTQLQHPTKLDPTYECVHKIVNRAYETLTKLSL